MVLQGKKSLPYFILFSTEHFHVLAENNQIIIIMLIIMQSHVRVCCTGKVSLSKRSLP